MLLDENAVKVFRERIIEWYSVYGERSLPWRNTEDAWAVLVAAFLLRKTTVRQVLAVYRELMSRFPSPEALLKADVGTLEGLLRPLGIEHQRARHLIEVAEVIVKRFGGKIPCDRKALESLPGVGEYIASEVLLAACGRPEPLLDRNMIRVLERVFGVKSKRKRPHTDPDMWAVARSIVPSDPSLAKEFSYGVLDFARTVCRAENPLCTQCSIKDICRYFSESKSQATSAVAQKKSLDRFFSPS